MRSVTKWLCALVLCALPTVALAQNPPPDPAAGRSMEFRPGLGEESQERVPGGRLVAIAYGVTLLALGGYVAFLARRAAKLDESLQRLEDDLARRRGDDGEAAP
jgi:CcmD family protein